MEMADIGTVRVPRPRWGGRWLARLRDLTGSPVEDWTEVADYAGTSSYQVARALNLGAAVPAAAEGERWEFGSRLETDGSSTLLVRTVTDN